LEDNLVVFWMNIFLHFIISFLCKGLQSYQNVIFLQKMSEILFLI